MLTFRGEASGPGSISERTVSSACALPKSCYPAGSVVRPAQWRLEGCFWAASHDNQFLHSEMASRVYENLNTGGLAVFNYPGDRWTPRLPENFRYARIADGRPKCYARPGDQRPIDKRRMTREEEETKYDEEGPFALEHGPLVRTFRSGEFNPWEIAWAARVPVDIYLCPLLMRCSSMQTNAGRRILRLDFNPKTLMVDFPRWRPFNSVARR